MGWELEISRQTIIHRVDKQGPIVYYRELIQYPVINHNRKEYEKEYVCVYKHMYESLCSKAEINTIL